MCRPGQQEFNWSTQRLKALPQVVALLLSPTVLERQSRHSCADAAARERIPQRLGPARLGRSVPGIQDRIFGQVDGRELRLVVRTNTTLASAIKIPPPASTRRRPTPS